jgi:uncharacterized protein (TIGR02231 family)
MMTELNSKIVEVTVYNDRARVTRRGAMHLKTGANRLSITNLPLTLNPESARASARGNARARLLGLEIERAYFIETPSEQIHQLEEQIETLKDEINGVEAQIELARQSRANLAAVSSRTNTYAMALAAGAMALKDQLALFDGLSDRMGELDKAIQGSLILQRQMQRRLEKLVNELQRWQGVPRRESYTAHIDVEILSPGDLTIELVYMVLSVSWQPIYDFRLVEADETRPALEAGYLAQVTQRSGEDWQDVSLALSTARPALAGRLPELDPWFIGPPPPPVIPRPAPVEFASAKPMRAKAARAAPMLAMEDVEAEVVEAEGDQSGAAVTYRVPMIVSIPADGAPQKVTVANFQLEPELDFVTVPKLVEVVYRRAKVINHSPYTLLPGSVNLFAGDEFVGTTRLDLTAPQGEIELPLGVDDRIKVERELKRREVDKKLIGNKRRITYAYEIKLENVLPKPVQLTLHDQFPVSKHEEVKIKLESADPRPTEQSELHQLKWIINLAAKEKCLVRFDFSVEYPPTLDVVGLA